MQKPYIIYSWDLGVYVLLAKSEDEAREKAESYLLEEDLLVKETTPTKYFVVNKKIK